MASYGDGYDPKYGYNRNAFAHKTPVTAVLGVTVKLLASGVGLVSEAVHHRKDKKGDGSQSERPDSISQQSNSEDPPIYVDVPPKQAEELIANKQAVPADGQKATHELVPADDQDNRYDTDETDWALDDAAVEAQADTIEEDTPHDFKWRDSVSNNRNSSLQRPSESLPFPVILPQRRPRTKTRGFIRAYAPILDNSGIDQNMFMSFLQDFHRAAQASPIFGVVQIACNVAGLYPDPLVGLGVQAVSIAAGIGQEIQERWRTNKYLDQANKELFEPRGLFALIVTYVPSNNKQTVVEFETVDIGAQAIARYNHPSEMQAAGGSAEEAKKPTFIEDLREKAKRLRVASGETQGEAQMPAICAPLIFPTLDTVVDQLERDNRNNSEGFANAMKAKTKNSSAFVANYFDRRAQAAYVSVESSCVAFDVV